MLWSDAAHKLPPSLNRAELPTPLRHAANKAERLRRIRSAGPSARRYPAADRQNAGCGSHSGRLVMATGIRCGRSNSHAVAGGYLSERSGDGSAGAQDLRQCLRRQYSDPARFTQTGAVAAAGNPQVGVVTIGRFPAGSDETAKEIAADLTRANYLAETSSDIRRWKSAKLLHNVRNALDLFDGEDDLRASIAEALVNEARQTLEIAGYNLASPSERAVDISGWSIAQNSGIQPGQQSTGRALPGALPARSTFSTVRLCCSAVCITSRHRITRLSSLLAAGWRIRAASRRRCRLTRSFLLSGSSTSATKPVSPPRNDACDPFFP